MDGSDEHLSLFRTQAIEAKGDIFYKNSRFLRSRRYYCEMRGATIVVFRSPEAAECPRASIEEIVTVVPLHNFDIDVVQKDEGCPRIYINSKQGDDCVLMYIRLSREGGDLQRWLTCLSRVVNTSLPSLGSLRIESVIGRGGGGKVFLVQCEENNKVYALKVINKEQTFKSVKAFRHVVSERYLMEKAGKHPCLLPMQFAFQTETNLFIGTPFCAGGDLASYMRNRMKTNPTHVEYDPQDPERQRRMARYCGRLPEDQTRRIAAEIILGLEHLHLRGIVYRDLKPENVFIDDKGYLQIGDYGLAKHLHESKTGPGRVKTSSICGTRNYLPPEMLCGRLYSFEADLWSLGVMLYRMLVGMFPFDAQRTKDVFQKIKKECVEVPSWVSCEGREMLYGLLSKDPTRRLTVSTLKKVGFFRCVKWDDVLRRRSEPAIPEIETGENAVDALQNFELSKLEGITLGEYVNTCECGKDVTGEHEVEENRRGTDVWRTMIGFEYGNVNEEDVVMAPLVVKQKSGGGLLSKLASIDVLDQLPLSPLTPGSRTFGSSSGKRKSR